MQSPTSTDVTKVLVLGAGLLVSIIIAYFLAQGNVVLFGAMFGAVGVLAYVLKAHQYTWQIIFILAAAGLVYSPTGFTVSPENLAFVLSLALAAIYVWRKRQIVRPEVLDASGLKFARGAAIAALVYLAVHFGFNHVAPYSPGDYAFKNAVRTYFDIAAGLAVFAWFSANPSGIAIRRNPVIPLAWIYLLFGLVLNLAVWLSNPGSIQASVAESGPGAPMSGMLFIPIINAVNNVFALRGVGPMGVLLAVAGLTSRDPQARRNGNRLLFTILLLAGLAGSALSGGRGAVLIALFFVGAILFVRGRIAMMVGFGGVAVLVVIVLNFTAPMIERVAPLAVQRTVQWVVVEDVGTARSSIESSTNWRLEMFHLAIEEWLSDPRIFWTGRSTYVFNSSDLIAVDIQGVWRGNMDSALRRGATHNLVTNLLLPYGLAGFILYYVAYIALLLLLLRLWLSRHLPDNLADVLLVALVVHSVGIVIATIGGSFLGVADMWLILLPTAGAYAFLEQAGPGLRPAGAPVAAGNSLPGTRASAGSWQKHRAQ